MGRSVKPLWEQVELNYFRRLPAYRFWKRWLSVGFVVLAVAWFVFYGHPFWQVATGSSIPQGILMRSVGAVMILGLGLYIARIIARHKRLEDVENAVTRVRDQVLLMEREEDLDEVLIHVINSILL